MDKCYSLAYKILGTVDEAAQAEQAPAWRDSMARIEKWLGEHGKEYFGGSTVGLIDYLVYPVLEKFLPLADMRPAAQLPKKEFPRIVRVNKKISYKICNVRISLSQLKWLDLMQSDPAVKEYLVPRENYVKYFTSMISGGEPDYDMMVE